MGAKNRGQAVGKGRAVLVESLARAEGSNGTPEVDKPDEVAMLPIAESVEFWDKKLGSSCSV